LKAGLQKTRASSEVPLRRKGGEMRVGARENAERFGEHFEELYLRAESFDVSVVDCIPQHEVDVEGGRVPGEKKVEQAAQRLNVSYPGCSGVSAAAVKAAVSTDAEVRGGFGEGGRGVLGVGDSTSRVGRWALEDPPEVGGSEQSWKL